MTMILKKDFISFNYRLFLLPAFTRAFFIKGSPHGELSYNIKKGSKTISLNLRFYFTNTPEKPYEMSRHLHTNMKFCKIIETSYNIFLLFCKYQRCPFA